MSKKEQYVYAISDGKYIKVGISNNPKRRLKQLSTGHPKKLYLFGYFAGGRTLEQQLHIKFQKIRSNGEWMYPSDELIEYLNNKLQDRYIIRDGEKLYSVSKMPNV